MQTTECRKAVELLLTYVEDPDLHRAEAETAIRHLSACLHCKRRMGHLFKAMTTQDKDRLTCAMCQDLLPDYVQAEIEGHATESRWRPIALHLETCPHCAAGYAALSDLLELAQGERGVDLPRYSVPDLSFLHTEPERPGKFWRLDELGRLIVEFSDELLRTLQAPARPPGYATTGLKSAQSSQVLYHISVDEIEDLVATITVEEQRDDATHCTLVVEVDVPSRGGWPHLVGTEVTIKRDEQKVETLWTDAFGKAVFKGIAVKDLADLVFEIMPRA